MSLPPSSSSARCCGSQPVSAVAEPEASSASRKACDRKGLSAPAHASHAAAGISASRATILTVTPSPPSMALIRSAHLEDRVDLDGNAAPQRVDAHRRARMAARVAQHLNHQVGGAVGDLRLLGEVGHAIDEGAQPHAAQDAVEIAAECGFCLGQDIEPAQPRCFLSVLEADLAAELAQEAAFTVPLA